MKTQGHILLASFKAVFVSNSGGDLKTYGTNWITGQICTGFWSEVRYFRIGQTEKYYIIRYYLHDWVSCWTWYVLCFASLPAIRAPMQQLFYKIGWQWLLLRYSLIFNRATVSAISDTFQCEQVIILRSHFGQHSSIDRNYTSTFSKRIILREGLAVNLFGNTDGIRSWFAQSLSWSYYVCSIFTSRPH